MTFSLRLPTDLMRSITMFSAAVLLLVVPEVATAANANQSRPDAATAALHVERIDGRTQLLTPDRRLVHETTAAVENTRLITLENSPTRIATWDERTATGRQSYFGVASDGETFDVVQPIDYQLRLRYADWDPATDHLRALPELPAPTDNAVQIVQFITPVLAEYTADIAALGGRIHGYLPEHALLVEMSEATKAAVAARPYVRWVGPYHTSYRLEEELRDGLTGRAALTGAQRYRIRVMEKGAAQKDAVADHLTALGGTIDALSPGGFMMEATLTPEQLLAVAEMNEVQFIDRWSPPRSTMNNVRIVGGGNYVESVAGYTGQGVRGEIMDKACQISHPDFAGRITVRGGIIEPDLSHGTATFGIVFGSGAGSSNARGMMPDAQGYFNDWYHAGSRHDDIGQLVTATYQCVFQSNSWGFSPTLNYTNVTAEMDDAVFDYDIVILNSQGNEGTRYSAEHAWAKNVVAVGAVYHWNNSNTGDDSWSGGASIGPAADGRIKPDLCFYYESIRTTAPTSSYTNSFGGTSAACPEAAGHFGLFFQMWADGIFGNPVQGSTVFSARPHSATARAVMINTAESYGFSGSGADLTRVHQGWGRPDVQNLYDRRNNLTVIDETDLLQAFQSTAYVTQIIAGNPGHDQLRVTLTYNDPAASTSASQHRVNDLTLKVTAPNGTVYYGNNGLLSGNWSTSGGSANTIDTVENVFINNPMSGFWVVEVRADQINQDGHVETPALDVDYALVIYGGATGQDCNDNDVLDHCDLDCNAPGCGSGCGQSSDCNANGIPDECDLPDCNANSIPDECELAGNDCDGNGIPDECDLPGNDCNNNFAPDNCEVAVLAANVTSPSDQFPCLGETAEFTITAPGADSFQWFRNTTTALADTGTISGATSPTLTIAGTSPADNGTYTCVAYYGCLAVPSEPAILHSITAGINVSRITPATVVACASSALSVAVMEVAVDEPAGVSLQWSKDGVDLADGGKFQGATGTRLEIYEPDGQDVGVYTCSIANACMATPTLIESTLQINSAFLDQPPATVCGETGDSVQVSATAATPLPELLRWYEGNTALSDGGKFSGVYTDTLTISGLQPSDDGRSFRLLAVVYDPPCANFSDDAILDVRAPGECPDCANFGDMDGDGDYDLQDMQRFTQCFGVNVSTEPECACAKENLAESIVGLQDWAAMEGILTGPQ